MARATSVEQVAALPEGTVVTVAGTPWTRVDGDRIRMATGSTPFNVPVTNLESILSDVIIPDDVPVQEPVFDAVESETATPATTVNYTTGLDPSEVQDALHEYLSVQGGLTSGEREGLYTVLDNLGLERPAENVTVTVRVEGSSEVTISDSYIESEIGGDVSTTDSSYEVSVEWNRTFEVERETSSGCACEDVDNDDVYNLLPNAGISGEVSDWTAYCSGSDCSNS